MAVCEIVIVPSGQARPARARVQEFAQSLIGALSRGGQSSGAAVMSWEGGWLRMRLHTPGADALEREHLTREACKLMDEGRRRWRITWRVADPGNRAADWRREAGLYLFTHAFDEGSPVCGERRGTPVPLYRLPLGDGLRQELGVWAHQYQLLDKLWLASDALERPAYLQLANPRSALNRRGRRLAAEVAKATLRPTYYYLHRYYARTRAEQLRRCPVCAGRWRVEPTARPFHGLGGFEFRCERCKLLSVQGVERAAWVR